jgi:uncharacterized protein
MDSNHLLKIAAECNVQLFQVNAAAELLAGGASVPFIARYRKEATGSLDEVVITTIRDRLHQLEELDQRRESILKSLKERELLTPDLEAKITAAETMSTIEDIYLPFRPKKRTRATVAREKGLEPLAQILFEQAETTTPENEALAFVDPEKGIASVEEALAGARDIIAEWVNENQEARARLRELFANKGVVRSKVIIGKEAEGAKYRDYFQWEEPVAGAPSHRVLAVRRGENEGFLDLSMFPPEEEALQILENLFLKAENPAAQQVKEALTDSYKRLLAYAMETDIRLETKKRADHEAIRVFAENLRELLLAPPLGQKNVLAVDPGIRTGCKIACLDRQGKLLCTETIYPFKSEKEKAIAAEKLRALCGNYQVEAIAIGNGTASRETEAFVKEAEIPQPVLVVMVNESGASIYSASETARMEFPNLDVSYRGAVSIGRRLMDPLAELVKIDPKSIGVGQYQHDVNQQSLKASLDDVVVSCVNAVGVEINTASEQLLTYVSGLGPQLAKNIILFRNEHGPLSSREELRSVPRLGPKAFEQAAGFLRIRDAVNPLDASAVHPESYPLVEQMAKDLNCEVAELMAKPEVRTQIVLNRYINEKVGLPTLNDIIAELAKPGRDPRRQFENVEFAEGIKEMGDLQPGMRLPGIVTNVTAFGAFVDIGVHQDGLVHISQLADRFVKDPNEVLKVGQRVTVTVREVDLARHRISLSMRSSDPAPKAAKEQSAQPKRDQAQKPKPAKNEKSQKRAPGPFNNPFAKVLRK